MLNVNWEIQAEYGQVSAIRKRVAIKLAQGGLTSQQQSNVLTAITEYLNNLVAHTQPQPSNIIVRITADAAQWQIAIGDNGPYFEALPHYLQQSPDIDSLGLRCDHMGLAIIKHLFDQAQYWQDQNHINWFELHLPNTDTVTSKAHVVLIDDDTSLLALLTLYLEQSYVVSAFDHAGKALDFLLAQPCDLIISDIHMPGLTGLQLKQSLSRCAEKANLPFIFLTGESDLTMQHNANALGIDDYLVKPIQKTQLLSVCSRVLKRSQNVQQHVAQRLEQQISNTLVPRLPDTLRQHYHSACFYQGTQRGGGDLLLHFQQTHCDTLILADLMGHDHQAKFFSHAFHGYFQGLMAACPQHYNAVDILNYLSNAVHSDALLSRTTVTCLVLQLFDNGMVQIANAGHPQPLLFNGLGCEQIEIGGLLPGLLPCYHYQSQQLDLTQHQLLMYTDGLLECGPDKKNDQQALQRLKNLLPRYATKPLTQQRDHLQHYLMEMTQNYFEDDTTFIFLGYS